MGGIQLVTVIAERGQGDRLMKVLRDHGGQSLLTSAALGTATGEMLQLLGLSRTEKELVLGLCAGEGVASAMTALVAGSSAVTFSVPLSSISVPLFQVNQTAPEQKPEQKREGEASMNETAKYSAIIVIANRGCIDLVMDAARSAGATGGTVIHARGSGAHEDERFFGVTLADEREVYFIVSSTDTRTPIMRAIVDQAGLHTPAKAIVFSLPVSHLAGFPQFSA